MYSKVIQLYIYMYLSFFRRRGRQRTRWSVGINNSTDMNLSKLWELVKKRTCSLGDNWRLAIGYRHGAAVGLSVIFDKLQAILLT